MSNHLLRAALEQQRDTLYNHLRKQTISGLFRQEYQLTTDGSTALLGGIDDDYIGELKQLAEDTSFDEAFLQKVETVNQLDNAAISRGFREDIERLINYITGNGFANELQALFIEYDFYYHYNGVATGFGRQEYPLIYEPRYMRNETDLSKEVFLKSEAINFKPAWPDCEDFEWTTEHLDVYYVLQELFQLHSRVLLHDALKQVEDAGGLIVLPMRPLTFYINAHDSEVMTLYRVD